jgi:hypothetical protein
MSDKRHYNTDDLHKDYKQAYGLMMKVTMFGVVGALVYFFVFIVYLGGWGHTPSTDYAETFNDRYPQDYKGLKLPEFGGPAAPEPKHHGDDAHAGEHPVTGSHDAADAAAHAAAGPATVVVSTTEAPDSLNTHGTPTETGTAVTTEEHHEEQGAH